jgi:uncharacterized protein YjiS (DUF1127 family)
MRALRAHPAKHSKHIGQAGAARATQRHGIVRFEKAAAGFAAGPLTQARRTMLFLDLYGVPQAQSEQAHARLPRVLRELAETITEWRRTAYDRRILSRMTIRQLEDLQLSWPDDFRRIKAHS